MRDISVQAAAREGGKPDAYERKHILRLGGAKAVNREKGKWIWTAKKIDRVVI